MATTTTGGVICTLAAHFLFATGILLVGNVIRMGCDVGNKREYYAGAFEGDESGELVEVRGRGNWTHGVRD